MSETKPENPAGEEAPEAAAPPAGEEKQAASAPAESEQPATEDPAAEPGKASVAEAEPAKPELPPIDVNEFRSKSLAELHAMAEAVPGRIPANASKAQLVFELLSHFAREGAVLTGSGVVEQAKENYAMLRDPRRSFRTSPDDL